MLAATKIDIDKVKLFICETEQDWISFKDCLRLYDRTYNVIFTLDGQGAAERLRSFEFRSSDEIFVIGNPRATFEVWEMLQTRIREDRCE